MKQLITSGSELVERRQDPLFLTPSASPPLLPCPTPKTPPTSDVTTILDPTLAANGTTIFAGDPNAPGGQQPVLTHALVSGSPAIDAGNNGLPTVTTDQRGLPRVVGAEVDIGSFEVQ
ncbi:MAG: hypothetical protein HC924_14730 [Synechococcaceae cyanobacterium SM2_3_2]|nr:hypothetical protein [Synechococcaceae cyanobacterium SM2_3_2]